MSDADVLIAYHGRDDANHAAAVGRMRRALEPGTRGLISAVNYAEVLIGPLRHAGGRRHGRRDLARFGIETIRSTWLSRDSRPAARVRMRLKLPAHVHCPLQFAQR